MNKKEIIIVLALIVLQLFSFKIGIAEESQFRSKAIYVLPLSLREVEDEAFSGTAVETVIFPEGFLRIGEMAFDKAWHLTDVYIPNTTEFIANSAFSAASELTIHGVDDSYAKDWAYKHEIPFVVDNVWNLRAQSGRSRNTWTDPMNRYIAATALIILFGFFRLSGHEIRSRRPEDRPEFYPIDYRFP